jgi:hypothetical protein
MSGPSWKRTFLKTLSIVAAFVTVGAGAVFVVGFVRALGWGTRIELDNGSDLYYTSAVDESDAKKRPTT